MLVREMAEVEGVEDGDDSQQGGRGRARGKHGIIENERQQGRGSSCCCFVYSIIAVVEKRTHSAIIHWKSGRNRTLSS